MSEFIYRTEDLKIDEVLRFFVETARDREIINNLKARNPVVLSGSRGVGKSFLVRVAEAELANSFAVEKVFPVYVSFNKSSLIHTADPNQFQHWMLARICAATIRGLQKRGLLAITPSSLSILAGGSFATQPVEETAIEKIVNSFEESWQTPNCSVDVTKIPTVDSFRDAIEDVCNNLGISRIVLLIDEAAHILLAQQQRQFFSLFRDLRSPYMSCKAAVYPGVTSFGEVFQPAHDATVLKLERDFLSADYLNNMREIVVKQGDSDLAAQIAQRGEHFNILAYASSGNPRILLKLLLKTPKLNSSEINETIREYFRNDVWSEHTGLAEKYDGHRSMIDWGRRFIEGSVLPDLQAKNVQYLTSDKNSSCFFWIHRDAPQQVKEALRLLAYTGIVTEHATGIKASRSEVGTRYAVNLGCLFALEKIPTTTSFAIGASLTPKRMIEFGANHLAYKDIVSAPAIPETNSSEILRKQLDKPVSALDITEWQKSQLVNLKLLTLGDVLRASEDHLKQGYYIGDKRARRMRNAAIAAVYEYLSG
jgi:hypothetical protein